MSLETFEPGDPGFDPAPRRPTPPGARFTAALLAVALIAVAVLSVAWPRPEGAVGLRGTVGEAWVPRPAHAERRFAKLETVP